MKPVFLKRTGQLMSGGGFRPAAALGAVVFTLLLFLLLPLMYRFSRARARALLVGDSRQLHRIHTAQLQQKKKPVPEKKQPRRIRMRSRDRQLRTGSRFQLDLSLAGGDGGGAALQQDDGKMIYTTGQVDTPPVRRRAGLPRYPGRARREGIETTVKVELLIDEQGLVQRVHFLKVLPGWGFEEAVRRAVRSWRFAPARLNNMPVRCRAELSIEFRL